MIKTPTKKELKLDASAREERAGRTLFDAGYSDGSATPEQIREVAISWEVSQDAAYGWYFELCGAHADAQAE